jgi:hypothetical protein
MSYYVIKSLNLRFASSSSGTKHFLQLVYGKQNADRRKGMKKQTVKLPRQLNENTFCREEGGKKSAY